MTDQREPFDVEAWIANAKQRRLDIEERTEAIRQLRLTPAEWTELLSRDWLTGDDE